MLFDAEAAWVEVEGQPSEGNSPARESLPCAADGKDKKLCYDVAYGQGGVSKTEELVGTRKDDDEDGSQDPSSECCVDISPFQTVVVLKRLSHCGRDVPQQY